MSGKGLPEKKKSGKSPVGRKSDMIGKKSCGRGHLKPLFIFTVFLFAVILFSIKAKAESSKDEDMSDAISFYRKYGSRTLVFENGAFWYGSKGKAGKDSGTRYGVEGQRFCLILSDGTTFECSIALQSDYNTGSCTRVSYVKSGDYYYSLYRVTYETILEKFRGRYKGTDFTKLMYNRTLRFQVDFYLSLVKDGEPLGIVLEKADGSYEVKGAVYQDLTGILSAASWSEQTKAILPDYFGIELSVYKPSVYHIRYLAVGDGISGRMDRQAVTYGERQRLWACSYEKRVTVRLVNVPDVDDYSRDKTLYEDLPENMAAESLFGICPFKGWSERLNGMVVFSEQQTVYNLSNVNDDEITLYAVFGKAEIHLPKEDYLKLKKLRLVGYSMTANAVLPADADKNTLNERVDLKPGETVSTEKNLVIYAVYQEKEKTVLSEMPDGTLSLSAVFGYDSETLNRIRSRIKEDGFLGRNVISALLELTDFKGKKEALE